MNQQRIDMEAITKELLKVQGDVSELIDRTNKVRDSAELTARLMQYGLRFVDDNQEIDAAITEAQKLYDCYEYEQSLETIGRPSRRQNRVPSSVWKTTTTMN